MTRALTIILLLLAGPALAQRDCGPLPRSIVGKAWAIDGDTLAMLSEGKRMPDIRLFGIQAPELRDKATNMETRIGMQSRAALDDLLAEVGNSTTCTAVEWDRYCRVVAWCSVMSTKGLRYLSVLMLDRGQAYVFTTYALRPPGDDEIMRLIEAERAARQARRGLWKHWLHD